MVPRHPSPSVAGCPVAVFDEGFVQPLRRPETRPAIQQGLLRALATLAGYTTPERTSIRPSLDCGSREPAGRKEVSTSRLPMPPPPTAWTGSACWTKFRRGARSAGRPCPSSPAWPEHWSPQHERETKPSERTADRVL